MIYVQDVSAEEVNLLKSNRTLFRDQSGSYLMSFFLDLITKLLPLTGYSVLLLIISSQVEES